ncbi:GntP family permease [Gallaecimonas pentaromativorans]|uniref:H+/gluconate symporter-like permease n=1 Tax=Gallaecimonas pentaromativorans TaxID=584787 RepID=A0A3N1P8B0_9GAMM|nr:SLC13 family permease [Gallaecimonas pentaromativorans]MED5523842.1 SLC13 family permease [Pseudomonadota bacterium]ROQ24773.1 H+/gluconate symporter-like permease [Gallaecimonas pentaromativorans]
MLSLIGLLVGLGGLIWLTMRGVNLFLSAPLCALLVAFTGGVPFWHGGQNDFVTGYMGGFGGFVSAWFLMFLLGSMFGKFMEDTGAAEAVARAIISKLGVKHAALAVVLACAVLTYGGVSLFVAAFSVYPVALSLFKDANLPRRFIPAALAFGSVTFTMTSAGSPEIQNWIPIKYLHTSPYAGWQVSLVVAVFMMVVGYLWLNYMLKKAVARGEHFVDREGDTHPDERTLPKAWTGLLPLVVVLVLSYLLHDSMAQAALIVALAGGVATLWLINFKHFINQQAAMSAAATGALVAIGNTAAVVGFGAVAKLSPAFHTVVDAMTSLPGNELIGASVAVSVIAGLTGSASGGQVIALPAVAPHYLQLGVDPSALHRVVAISSGALDSLPHNGYVVTTIRAICGERHEDAYWPLAALTVVVPIFGVILAIALFSLF